VGVSKDVGLRLAVYGAFVIAVMLTASSCLPGQGLLGVKNSLPTASATLHWATIDMPRGSYCWNSGGQGQCADSAGTDQLLKTGYLSPYRTAGGFDVKITFHSASQPTGFNVQLIQSPNGQRMAVDESSPHTFGLSVSPPAPTGLYVYRVTGTWAEGDVSFFLTIQLLPGVA
jgi:hypothetical protein